jgi:hypothetical protein
MIATVKVCRGQNKHRHGTTPCHETPTVAYLDREWWGFCSRHDSREKRAWASRYGIPREVLG